MLSNGNTKLYGAYQIAERSVLYLRSNSLLPEIKKIVSLPGSLQNLSCCHQLHYSEKIRAWNGHIWTILYFCWGKFDGLFRNIRSRKEEIKLRVNWKRYGNLGAAICFRKVYWSNFIKFILHWKKIELSISVRSEWTCFLINISYNLYANWRMFGCQKRNYYYFWIFSVSWTVKK